MKKKYLVYTIYNDCSYNAIQLRDNKFYLVYYKKGSKIEYEYETLQLALEIYGFDVFINEYFTPIKSFFNNIEQCEKYIDSATLHKLIQ